LPSARKKGISIKTGIDTKIAPVLRGDPERLGQILNNLLDNGVQFGGGGEVELQVTVDHEEADKQCLLFEVSAAGIVLAGGDQLHLLDPKADEKSTGTSSSTEIISCANLGLSICKKLVELMGGALSARGGTTGGVSKFLFRLNLEMATDPEQLLPQTARTSSDPAMPAKEELVLSLPGPVLVVDDSRVQREILVGQLQRLGVTAHSASSGREAIELISKTKYSAVLMDCQMPDIDGCAASQTIRRGQQPADKHLLIIGMTASTENEERDRCLQSGMDGALTKPIALGQLRKVLEGGK
jgi:CheY-like chemotaxis protein